MKYLVRSIKYFIYLIILISIILGGLVLIGAAEADIETMFRNGYDSLWQIALLFVVIAAIYPMFGFIRRDAMFPGSWDESREDIRRYMENHNYTLEKEEEGTMTFKRTGIAGRIARMFEDRVTITSRFGGATLEGLRKDILRLCAGIEHTLNPSTEEQ